MESMYRVLVLIEHPSLILFQVLQAVLKSSIELEGFLNFLKPLMQKMQLRKLNIDHCEWETFQMLSNVLEIKSVDAVFPREAIQSNYFNL